MIGTANSFQDLIIEISSDSSNQSNQLRVPADVDFSLFELNFWNSFFPIIYIMLSAHTPTLNRKKIGRASIRVTVLIFG